MLTDEQKREAVIEWLTSKIQTLDQEWYFDNANLTPEDGGVINREIDLCKRWQNELIEQRVTAWAVEQNLAKRGLEVWEAKVQSS